MVERNNPLFKVLFANALLANNKTLADLDAAAAKTMGVFNFDDNKSFDSTHIPANLHRMYFAEKTPSGKVLRSTSDYIDVKGIYDVRKITYQAPVAQVWYATLPATTCSQDYGLRFNLHNGETMHIDGINPLMKSFVVAPACSGDACSCPEAGCVHTAYKLKGDIDADPDNLFAVRIGFLDGSTFTEYATEADWDAAVTAGDVSADDCPTLEITTKPVNIMNYCAVNYAWTPVRTTLMSVHPIGGYVGGITITEKTAGVVERGAALDVKFLEYQAQGTDGHGNYRESALYGVATMQVDYQVDMTKTYDLYYISWSNDVTGGWNLYKDSMRTVIAVESDNSLETNLDNIFTALANTYNFHFETVS